MKIVIASDSFKGSLSSREVNDIIAEAIISKHKNVNIIKVNIADGGEGSLEAITSIIKSDIKVYQVTNALGEKKVNAKWAIFNNGNDAFFEVASVVGLYLIDEKKRNPLIASTFGIGELILHILKYNIKNIYIGLGGSSTNDAGTGALKALGVKFLDKNNKEIVPCGLNLLQLEKIDVSEINKKVLETNFILLSDVENFLCGNSGASYTFAGQKGASIDDIKILDKALLNFQNILKRDFDIDVSNLKGGGAAGGIGAGFYAFLNAQIKSGINSILEIINFEEIIKDADLVITGEGKIDTQTIYGKAIKGISKIVSKYNKPLIAICGILEGDKEIIKRDLKLRDIITIVNKDISKEDSFKKANYYLKKIVEDNIGIII